MDIDLENVFELSGKPRLLIVDGAGTLFDPGSVVPVYGFQGGFREYAPKGSDKKFEFEPSFDLVMKYMGRDKLAHVKLLLGEPVVKGAFSGRFGRMPNEEDAKGIYTYFKEQLYPAAQKTDEIAGVKDAMFKLKAEGIPIVMTTGYDRRMVDETKKRLPWLNDLLLGSFTSSDVKAGRPAPYLIHRAMECALVENSAYCVNAGDTLVDTQSADNACMPGIVVLSGSILTKEKAYEMDEECGRKHLVMASLVELVEHILDRTLATKIIERNLFDE